MSKARENGESASAALVHKVMLKVRAAEAGTRAAAIARREHTAGPRGGHSTLNGERQQWRGELRRRGKRENKRQTAETRER